jgi:hypothetical protein
VRVFGRFGLGRGRAQLRPEQKLNNATVEQEKVDEIVAKQDARYDAMSDEERKRYYMKPNLITRIKKTLRGQ